MTNGSVARVRAFEFIARPSVRLVSDSPGEVHSISGHIVGLRPSLIPRRFVTLWVGDWLPALHQELGNGEFYYRFRVSLTKREGYTRVFLNPDTAIDVDDWTVVRLRRSALTTYDAPCPTVIRWLLGLTADTKLPHRLWMRLTRHRLTVIDAGTPYVRRKRRAVQ